MKNLLAVLLLSMILAAHSNEVEMSTLRAGNLFGPSENLQGTGMSFMSKKFETEALSNHCYWDSLMHVADDNLEEAIERLEELNFCTSGEKSDTAECQISLESHKSRCMALKGHVCEAKVGVYRGKNRIGEVSLPYCLPNACMNHEDLRYWLFYVSDCAHADPSKSCQFEQLVCQGFQPPDVDPMKDIEPRAPDDPQTLECIGDEMQFNQNQELTSDYDVMQREHTQRCTLNVGQGNHECTETTPEFRNTCDSLGGHVCNATWQFYAGHTVQQPECIPNSCSTPNDLAHILGKMHGDRTTDTYGRDYALLSLVCPNAFAGDTSHLTPTVDAGRRIKVHRVTLVIGVSMEFISDLEDFGHTILTELSLSTQVSRSRYRIHEIRAGSVIVVIDVLESFSPTEISSVEIVEMIQTQIAEENSPMDSFVYLSQVEKMQGVEILEAEECIDGIFRSTCTDGEAPDKKNTVGIVVAILTAIAVVAVLAAVAYKKTRHWKVPGYSRKDMAQHRQVNVQFKLPGHEQANDGIVDVDLGPVVSASAPEPVANSAKSSPFAG